MKIIILGAGQVGGTLAEILVGEKNDVTIVDNDNETLKQLQDKLDLRTVFGRASHPSSLRNAGAENCDMIIAVTSSDETNMVACQIASALFNTPKKIARIRATQYIDEAETLFNQNAIEIDHLISPEKLVTDYINRLVEYPGTLQVVNFAEGKVSIVSAKALYGGSLIGYPLSALKEQIPHINTHIAAIFRHNRPIRPQGSTIIEAGDEIFFVCATQHIKAVMSVFQRLEKPYSNIMIVGGGNIGAGLAARLEQQYRVKLIEKDMGRAEHLSEKLARTTVFCGDAADQELLKEENIEDVDLFIALTNRDEDNIMSSMLAKRLGAKRTMVLIQHKAYFELLEDSDIDVTISPQQTTISALLCHVRKADIVSVASLRRGIAEAIEVVVHGENSHSHIVGKRIEQIKLPTGTTIGAIARNEDIIVAKNQTVIEPHDRVILFLTDKRVVPEVERLFQSD
ncbi:Trk system potassium transporter TrkA [Thorsellia kenyensis]|uniref:Trk system potassium uptake protein TrkA n=1 Tax=Thorsellia kenyensis TaxID=1549888 RepID=A0ABV6CD40_9GAMM